MSGHRQDDLTIITKAKELVNETMRRTASKFPKRVRFTLANRMDELALQILHDIIAANEIFPTTPEDREKRRRLQTEVLTSCKMLLTFKFGVMYEHGAITREEIAESYQSWRSHAMRGDCRQLVAKFDSIYKTAIERSKDEHVQNIRKPACEGKGN